MRFSGIASSVALITACCAALAAGDLPGDAAAGRDFALGVCAECHLVADDQGSWPVSEAPPFREVADSPGMTELALRAFMQTPHRTMPNILLTPEETDNIIAYILSLKSAE